MPEIPASIQRVINVCEKVVAGDASIETLEGLFVKARQTAAFERASLERFQWDVIWTARIRELVAKVQAELQVHERVLQSLESAFEAEDLVGLDEAGRELKYSAETMAALWGALADEAGKQQAFSPYPVYDHLIKTAKNVIDGNIESSVLSGFFPPAANFTVRLRAAVKRFTLFYGKSSLAICADKVTRNIEAAMGAIDKFLQNGDKKLLNSAKNLLMSTTVTMYTVMADMGIWAANERKYARTALVEDLFRAREAGLEGQDLKQLWDAVGNALRMEVTEVQTLLNHPLGTLCSVHRDALKVGMARVIRMVSDYSKGNIADVDLAGLDLLLFNLDRLIKSDLVHVDIEHRLVEGAPNFEELLVTVGLAIDGKIEPEAFMVILQETIDHVNEVRDNLDGALSRLSAEDFTLLEHCVELQAKGCETLASWCESGEADALREGWKCISSTLPSVRRLMAQMKKNLGVDKPKADTVTCMRCGTTNPSTAHCCSKCSAVLLQLVQSGPTEYTDLETGLSDGEGNAAIPANIAKLERLVSQVESGEAYTDEVAKVVGELLSSANSYRNIYIRRVREALVDENVDSSLVERFESNMNNYIEGLELCRNFVNEPNIEFLYNGLDIASNAALELSDIQSELSAYF